MLGLKRVMCLVAMLSVAPLGFMACNEDEDTTTTPSPSIGEDGGSDTDGGDADGGDTDGGETDAGSDSKP